MVHRERACTKRDFCQGGLSHGRKFVFSLFRETNRDDSISYHDWHAKIEATISKGYEPDRVKMTMFEAMESMAKDHAANIDQYGILTTLEILEGLDRLYGVSMTFQFLNAALCGLQQRASESCQDYYDCLTQITMLLWERHSNHFHPGKLRYHSSKLEFLTLKWAITEQFKEYLQYQPFKVKMDNNPLTYIMSMPNLDAVGHHWVVALVGFNFTIEYLRGSDNKVANALSRVEGHLELDPESMRELLSHTNKLALPRAETDDLRLMQEHTRNEQEIIMQARMLADSCDAMHNLADSHWIITQQNEPVIRLTMEWIKRPKNDHSTLSEFLKGHVPDVIQ